MTQFAYSPARARRVTTTPRADTQRQSRDGELILRMAAQRLAELGFHARALVLRGLTLDGGLTVRAEAFYDIARRESPDSDRAALLGTAARLIANQRVQ